MYAVGSTEEDRRKADDLFLENMLVLCKHTRPKWLYHQRQQAAISYYIAVRTLGKKYFQKRISGEISYG